MAKNNDDTIIWIIIGIIIAAFLYKYSGMFVISNTSSTGYQTFSYTPDWKVLTYSNVVGPDYNYFKENHAYLAWGNNYEFTDVYRNPQVIMFYLVNYFGVDANDIRICGTDRYDIHSACGISGAVCPTSIDAANRVSALINPAGLSWSGNPSEYPCPDSPNKYFIKNVPSDILNSLAILMSCKISGTYRGCNQNGNNCGSEITYNLNGDTVTWANENGFSCHVPNIPNIPSGYSDIRITGNVQFQKDIKQDYYRLAEGQCTLVNIFISYKTDNDYTTLSECQQHLPLPTTYYRLSNNQCNLIQLYPNELTNNDYNSSDECNLYVLSSYYRVINSTCYSVNLYGYQKTANDYLTIPSNCANTIIQNVSSPGQTIYVQNITYVNVTTNQTANQTITITNTITVQPSFFQKYGIALIILVIAGLIIFWMVRK